MSLFSFFRRSAERTKSQEHFNNEQLRVNAAHERFIDQQLEINGRAIAAHMRLVNRVDRIGGFPNTYTEEEIQTAYRSGIKQ